MAAAEGVNRSVESPGKTVPSPDRGVDKGAPLPGDSAGRPVPKSLRKVGGEPPPKDAPASRSATVNTAASFSLDDSTGMITIRLTNATTGEFIRQIPPRDYVKLALANDNVIGTLFNTES